MISVSTCIPVYNSHCPHYFPPEGESYESGELCHWGHIQSMCSVFLEWSGRLRYGVLFTFLLQIPQEIKGLITFSFSDGKASAAMQKTWVRSLGWEDPLEKEMATHSSTLAWKIPWTEEPGRLLSMGSQSQTWLSDFTLYFFRTSTWSPLESHLSINTILGFPAGSDGKESAWGAGDIGSIPGLERSPGREHSNPLQYSCLENFMDSGAPRATVHGVTESQTRLSD